MFTRGFLIVASVTIPTAAQAVPNLTPQQLQRIERDLVPSRSQTFFQEGKVQLEREIRRLESPKPGAPVLQQLPSSTPSPKAPDLQAPHVQPQK